MIVVTACSTADTAGVTVLGPNAPPPPPPPPPPPGNVVPPDLPRATPDTVRPSIQRTVRAHNSSGLSAAVSSARAGDEILLDPGVVYSFPSGLKLPARGDGGWVVIRTDLPSVSRGARVDSTLNFAKITCTGGNCPGILIDQPGDHGWRFEVLEVTSGANGSSSAVRINGTGTTVPDRIVFDRVYVHAEQTSWSLRQCIRGNASNIAVLRSVLVECKTSGSDAVAFVAYNTPGPILIYNNLLSAASIPFLLGGADPANASMIPRDVVFARNHVWRPNSWKNSGWTVKNLFELKMGIRVHVWGNVFENHWRHAQSGYAILLKTANQSCGPGTFTETGHVTFERNILRNVDMGLNIAMDPTGCGVDMHDVLIQDIVCEQCGPNGDHGDNSSRNMLILGPTDNLTINGFTSLGPNMHTAMEIAASHVVAGRTLTVQNVVFQGPTAYGLRKRPISDTYTNFNFVNAYGVSDNCGRYSSGWTCPSSVPSGAGANMSAVNAATSGVVR